MGEPIQLLVIGPGEFAAHLAQALPRGRLVHVEHPLEALWIATGTAPEAVVILHPPGHELLRAIECLRRTVPQARIVAACSPADEPAMRAVLAAGADEYILAPLVQAELEAALRVPARPPWPPEVADGPTLRELVDLGEVLKQLGAGAQSALDRFTNLLRESLGATFVSIRLDELSSAVGQAGPAVLTTPIVREERPVGAIALGACVHGAYAATTAARLVDYARLLDIIITQARERAHWQELACLDGPTGLPNLRRFEAELRERLSRAAALRRPLLLILFELEDQPGAPAPGRSAAGDELPRSVSRLLRSCVRAGDLVARIATNEFAVVFGCTDPPRAAGSQPPREVEAVVQRYRLALGQTQLDIDHLGGPAGVGVLPAGTGAGALPAGLGVLQAALVSYPWDAPGAAELLAAARVALQENRAAGLGRIPLSERCTQA